MQFHDAPADRQSDPGAGPSVPRHSMELLEDQAFFAHGKAWPSISNFQNEIPSGVSTNQFDFSSGWRILGCIVEQVRQHLLHQQTINGDRWEIVRD
jgi:hypothetical protein